LMMFVCWWCLFVDDVCLLMMFVCWWCLFVDDVCLLLFVFIVVVVIVVYTLCNNYMPIIEYLYANLKKSICTIWKKCLHKTRIWINIWVPSFLSSFKLSHIFKQDWHRRCRSPSFVQDLFPFRAESRHKKVCLCKLFCNLCKYFFRNCI